MSKMDKLKRISKAHTQYKLADGTRVPGVTTILGVLNKPALVKWANNLGLQGIDSSKYVDAAARIGTLIHAMVESHITGEELDLNDYTPNEIGQAQVGFKKFIEWKQAREFKLLLSEAPIVSEEYRYGGTVDCVAVVDGKVTLVDFKTGKGIYDEMLCQVSAYNELLKIREIQTDEIMILRIGRNEEEGFETRTIRADDVQLYFEVFKNCLNIYETKKKLGWR
jgi:hypothetical protein